MPPHSAENENTATIEMTKKQQQANETKTRRNARTSDRVHNTRTNNLFVITSLIILSIWQAQSQTNQPIQRAGSFDSVIGDITNYVEACLAKEAAPLVVALAEYGGRMEPPEGDIPQRNKIHALCINRNNFEGCVSTLTTKSSLEQNSKPR